MDNALVKKINVYPTLAQEAGLITDADTGVSTLVKADVSWFHAPPTSLSVNEAGTEVSPELTAYEQGFQEGTAQAEGIYKETIELMEMALGTLQSQISNIAQQIEVSHLSVVSGCLRAILPSLADMAADFELRALIREACAQALNGKVQLITHPESLEALSKFSISSNDQLVLQTDTSLSQGNVQVRWASGGGHVDVCATSDKCLELIETTMRSMMNTEMGDISDE